MSAVPFDTLKYVEALTAAGFSEAQAKAQAQALGEVLRQTGQGVATKLDIADLKTEIQAMKGEIQAMINRLLLTLTGIVMGSMAILTGIFAAVVKLP